MNYIDRIKSAKTIEDLYNLLEELNEEHRAYSKAWDESGPDRNDDLLKKSSSASFYAGRVQVQIMHLEKQGIFLNSVGKETANDSTD